MEEETRPQEQLPSPPEAKRRRRVVSLVRVNYNTQPLLSATAPVLLGTDMAAALGVGMSHRTHADFTNAQAPYDQLVSDETDLWEERWKELNVKLAALTKSCEDQKKINEEQLRTNEEQARKIEALVESAKMWTRMAQEDAAAIVSGGARRVPRGSQPNVEGKQG